MMFIKQKIDKIRASVAKAIVVLGDFNFAPTPTRDPNNVISIFSDVYNNVPVDFFNGFWQPYQTTESADFEINGDNVLNYTFTASSAITSIPNNQYLYKKEYVKNNQIKTIRYRKNRN